MASPTRDQLRSSAEATSDGSAAQQESSLAKLKLISWSGLFFAVLQSVCSAFIALSGLRLLIGIGAAAAATGALKIADKMHIDAIRIPMMLLALFGSCLNLVVLWQIWRLRKRSASAWRLQPVPKNKKRSEYLQFALSILTLLLLAIELFAHHKLQGRW
jgi:hypothetical protein